MAKITAELIDDIFNIPRDGSNISDQDDDSFGEMNTGTSVTFEEKAQEITEELSKLPPVPKVPTAAPVVETVVEAPKEEVKVPDPKPTFDTAIKKIQDEKKDQYGDIFGDVKPPEIAPVLPQPLDILQKERDNLVEEAKKEEDQKVFEALEETTTLHAVVPERKAVLQINESANQNHWKLDAPSPKYEKFYEEKVLTLSNYLLKGGEIPFDQYYQELEDASVDTNVPSYDTEEVGRRITEVMQWRDRIKHIQLHANSQYFVWKQYMDLLPGVLARIEYERGKQEGVMYEHMSDLHGYFGKLEGLHKSCEFVSKHLDAAYASLSRQVAIAQPLNEVERYTPNPAKPMTPQMSRFDGLTKANQGTSVSGVPLKEAAKSAEPKKTSPWDRM